MVFMALLVALALVISLFESVIPIPFVAPGAKLGLSNIVILVTLVVFGFRYAIVVACLKSVLLMLITGSVSSMFFSLAGAIFASLVMAFAYYKCSKIFSLIGVSILGAVAHNFGQLTIAYLIMQNPYIYSYLPVLVLAGLFTGFFVGLSSRYITRKLKAHFPNQKGSRDDSTTGIDEPEASRATDKV